MSAPTSPDEPTPDPTVDHLGDPGPSAATEPPPASVSADRWRWPRRIASLVALALAIVFCVRAIQRAPSPGVIQSDATDPAIVRQVPEPGGHVLHQTSIGVDLLSGYDGRLTIDGTVIPEDEMDGAAPPGSPAYDPRYGVRPNTTEPVFFTPGKGKVLDRYGTGEVHITVRFWRIADGERSARSVSWAFFVN
jgi:hypothetical protein